MYVSNLQISSNVDRFCEKATRITSLLWLQKSFCIVFWPFSSLLNEPNTKTCQNKTQNMVLWFNHDCGGYDITSMPRIHKNNYKNQAPMNQWIQMVYTIYYILYIVRKHKTWYGVDDHIAS